MLYMAIFVLLDGLLLLALTVPLLPHWVAYFLLALSILVIVSGCLMIENVLQWNKFKQLLNERTKK